VRVSVSSELGSPVSSPAGFSRFREVAQRSEAKHREEDKMAMAATGPVEVPRDFRRVIIAAAVGNVIEWYDFYIFGSLAAILSVKFFEQARSPDGLLSSGCDSLMADSCTARRLTQNSRNEWARQNLERPVPSFWRRETKERAVPSFFFIQDARRSILRRVASLLQAFWLREC
jgi:hypothetical protein